jgi:hypothetical protein
MPGLVTERGYVPNSCNTVRHTVIQIDSRVRTHDSQNTALKNRLHNFIQSALHHATVLTENIAGDARLPAIISHLRFVRP